MDYIISNGKLTEEASIYSNRSFRYGDGFFESIRWVNGRMPFLDAHWERIVRNHDILQMAINAKCHKDRLRLDIGEVVAANKQSGNVAIRVIFWRSGEGKYLPDNNESSYYILSSQLESNGFPLNEDGLTIGFYEDNFKPIGPISNVKTTSALLFVMASKFVKDNGLDDCLILNSNGRVCEASSSNVFVVKNGTVYTPPLSEGCVAGVMRDTVIGLINNTGVELKEVAIAKDRIADADEVFLTNGIQGNRWVKSLNETTFSNQLTKRLSQALNELLSN